MNAVTMTCIDCGVTNARRASWAEERPGCARRMLSAAYWGVVIPCESELEIEVPAYRRLEALDEVRRAGLGASCAKRIRISDIRSADTNRAEGSRDDGRRQAAVGRHRARGVRGGRGRRRHAEPPGEAQRDEPHAEPRDVRDAGAPRVRRPLRRRRADRGRGVLLGRHGPAGVLPRDGRQVESGPAQGPRRGHRLAVPQALPLHEADDRDGQRLVLRRRVRAAWCRATWPSPPRTRSSGSPR